MEVIYGGEQARRARKENETAKQDAIRFEGGDSVRNLTWRKKGGSYVAFTYRDK